MDMNASQLTQFSASQGPTMYPVPGQVVPILNHAYQSQFLPYGASIIHHPFNALQQQANWQSLSNSSSLQMQPSAASAKPWQYSAAAHDIPIRTLSDLKQHMLQSQDSCVECKDLGPNESDAEPPCLETFQRQVDPKGGRTQQEITSNKSRKIATAADKVIKPHMKLGAPEINDQGVKIVKVVDEFKNMTYFKCAYCASNRIFTREELLIKHIRNCSDYSLQAEKHQSLRAGQLFCEKSATDKSCEGSTEVPLDATQFSRISNGMSYKSEDWFNPVDQMLNFEVGEKEFVKRHSSDQNKLGVCFNDPRGVKLWSTSNGNSAVPRYLATSRGMQAAECTATDDKALTASLTANPTCRPASMSRMDAVAADSCGELNTGLNGSHTDTDDDTMDVLKQLTDMELRQLLKDHHPALYQYLDTLRFAAVDKDLLLRLILGLISKPQALEAHRKISPSCLPSSKDNHRIISQAETVPGLTKSNDNNKISPILPTKDSMPFLTRKADVRSSFNTIQKLSETASNFERPIYVSDDEAACDLSSIKSASVERKVRLSTIASKMDDGHEVQYKEFDIPEELYLEFTEKANSSQVGSTTKSRLDRRSKQAARVASSSTSHRGPKKRRRKLKALPSKVKKEAEKKRQRSAMQRSLRKTGTACNLSKDAMPESPPASVAQKGLKENKTGDRRWVKALREKASIRCAQNHLGRHVRRLAFDELEALRFQARDYPELFCGSELLIKKLDCNTSTPQQSKMKHQNGAFTKTLQAGGINVS